MSDLYVLQNHLGLIKIGKTSNIDRRLKQIERNDLCNVILVALHRGQGELEKKLLSLFSEAQLTGEWFDGDDETRSDIGDLLCSGKKTQWPFRLASDQLICDWLDRVEVNRRTISIEKLTQGFIRMMERHHGHFDTFPDLNWKIGQIIWEYDEGLSYTTIGEKIHGKNEHFVFLDGVQQSFFLPKFTTNIADALFVWPEEGRPKSWNDTAWSCCLEGLKVRRKNMMERHRVASAAFTHTQPQPHQPPA